MSAHLEPHYGDIAKIATNSNGNAIGIIDPIAESTVYPLPTACSTEATSRALTSADNGKTLEVTATITLTVPVGLPTGFACAIIPSGTTSIASSGGALLNGATTTLTRAATGNTLVAIVGRASAADSYVVTGS